ncbi:hypothetical protein FQN60_010959, partial [Etheostoma spectabile]
GTDNFPSATCGSPAGEGKLPLCWILRGVQIFSLLTSCFLLPYAVFMGCHLSEEPVELHAFGCGIAALNEARPAIHVNQALVVVIINGGTEKPNMELLSTAEALHSMFADNMLL